MSISQRLAELEKTEVDSRFECPSCHRRLHVLIVENDDPASCVHCGAVLPDVPDFVTLIVKRYVGVSTREI